jgi:murein L,D-transpeptidase YcbB/YkuD
MRTSTNQIVILLAFFLASGNSSALDTTKEENTCAYIGFKKGTESFGNCVLELIDRNKKAVSKNAAVVTQSEVTKKPKTEKQATGDGSSEDAICQNYGFKPATGEYSSCRLQIDLAKQNAKQQQDIYQQQKEQYDAQVAAVEKQRAKEKNMKQLEMGLRMMGGQSVQDAAMATARMPPLPQAPGPITQRITMPNGRSMTCTTTGTNTNCF